MLISEDILQKAHIELVRLQQQNVTNESIEVEVRFGQYFDNSFSPGVTQQDFVRLKDWAIGNYPGFTFVHSIDEIYSMPYQSNVTQRITTVFDESEEPTMRYRTLKTPIQKYDFPEHFFRLSLAREDTDEESIAPGSQRVEQREKKRWSFQLNDGNFRLDLTQVTMGNSNPNYEVELEVLESKSDNLMSLNQWIRFLLHHVLYTSLLYTATEKAAVISEVNVALGSRVDYGNNIDNKLLIQARNLKLRDMVTGGLIPQTDRDVRYTVTIKADGVRKLLYIGSVGIYLVSSPNSVMKILGPSIAQQLSTWQGTVIEGEFIPIANLSPSAPEDFKRLAIYFLMYDTLSLGGDSSIQNKSLFGRLEPIQKLQDVVNPLAYDQNGQIKPRNAMLLTQKEFLQFKDRDQFYSAVSDVLTSEYPFLTDGMLFTPDNYRYDPSVSALSLPERKLTQRPDLLKWKPPDQLTMDLEVRHIATKTGPQIELLANASSRWPHKRIQSVDQIYRQLIEAGLPNRRVVFVGSSENPYNSETDLIMNELVTNAPSGTVLEFRWTQILDDASQQIARELTAGQTMVGPLSNRGQLEAIRIRYDKQTPNSIDVVLDVWGDIFSPIDLETITGQKFSLIFRYHNLEKWNLYNYVGRALPKTPVRSLLDIGSGRGGDVYKWLQNGFTHVVCVEPNEENRVELMRRLSQTKLKYLIVPTTGQDVATIVQNVKDFIPGGTVDVISYMLSLSFFFDNTESMMSIHDITNQTLRKDGYFISFTIDGAQVQTLFTDNRLYIEANSVKRANFQMIQFELRPPSREVSSEHIFVNIPDSIVTNQIEYLTDISKLTNQLSQIGLKTVSETRANRESFMTNEEMIYSTLFMSIILQREDTLYPFDQIQTMLQQGLFVNFNITADQTGVSPGNTRVEFVDKNGEHYSTIARYDQQTNQILPPVEQTDFEMIKDLLQKNAIVDFGISPDQSKVSSGNSRMFFVDQVGKIYSAIVQYNPSTNAINPPI